MILAGGQSKRMGSKNKLLALINGKPMIAITAETIIASKANTLVTVTGFQSKKLEKVLKGLNIELVHNKNTLRDYAIAKKLVNKN